MKPTHDSHDQMESLKQRAFSFESPDSPAQMSRRTSTDCVCGFMMLHVFERLQTEGASATLCRCSHEVWVSVCKCFKHCVQDGTGPVHTVAYRMFVPEVFSNVH